MASQLERHLHQRVRARGSFASTAVSIGSWQGVGIALRLLGEAGVLQENFGQACERGFREKRGAYRWGTQREVQIDLC